ncbi:MAG: NAD-dependent epimerase/dehydratase family protein [Acidobacteriota bacterium]
MGSARHVIFGGGQVGSALASILLARGFEVLVAKRSPTGIPDGAEAVLGDASDPEFCRAAATEAAVVYHCMNPPYSTQAWAELIPRYMANMIDAAARAGTRLVVLDNLYMLGKPDGKPLTASTPMNPCSRKGEIRAKAATTLFEAHKRGDLLATCGRASDFYGPGGRLTQVGDHFWPRVLKGRGGQVAADPDAIHTYHYIPDVAAGLAALGTGSDAAFGRPWMLPCGPAESLRDLVRRFEKPLGAAIALSLAPGWMLSLMSLVAPPLRELAEMQYQWAEPFVVDDGLFREHFGVMPEHADKAAADTVAWARRHYAGS